MSFFTTNKGVIVSLAGLSFLFYVIFYSLDYRVLGLFSFFLASVIVAIYLRGKRSLKSKELWHFSYVMGALSFFFLLFLSFIQDSTIILFYAIFVAIIAIISTHVGFRFIQL